MSSEWLDFEGERTDLYATVGFPSLCGVLMDGLA